MSGVNKVKHYYYPNVIKEGPAGLKGFKGNKGCIGSQGIPGPLGLSGPFGPKGDFGDRGLKGQKGEKGDIGPIGPVGIKGEKGPLGLKGEKGNSGNIISGYYVDSTNGLVIQYSDGTQSLPIYGLSGDKGEKGEPGAIGDKGEQGPNGPSGPTGEKGDPGNHGLDGQPGIGISTIQEDGDKLVFTLTNSNNIEVDYNIKGDKGEIGDIGPSGLNALGVNYTDYYYNMGFFSDFYSYVFSSDIPRQRFYLQPYQELKYKQVNSNIIVESTSDNTRLLKNVNYNNQDLNYRELYSLLSNTGEKEAGSLLSVDPININPLSNILSSGHNVIANGIPISKQSVPQTFSLNMVTLINNRDNGFSYVQNIIGSSDYYLQQTTDITNIPDYQNMFFGNVLVNNIQYYIPIQVFIRFEIHSPNVESNSFNYHYLDNTGVLANNTGIEITNNNFTAAFTLRSYSNWISINNNSVYPVPAPNNWTYRTNHPKYNIYNDPTLAHNVYSGEKFCVRISFSKPDFNMDNLDISGQNLSSQGDPAIANVESAYNSLVANLISASGSPTNYYNYFEQEFNLDNGYVNNILSNGNLTKVHIPSLLFANTRVNELNMNIKFETVI